MTERPSPTSPADRVPLAQWLRAAAQDLQQQQAPPFKLPRAAAAAAAAVPPVRGSGLAAWGRPLAWSGALSCVLVLIGAAWLMAWGAGKDRTMLAGSAAGTRTETQFPRQSAFLPVASPERWVALPGEGGAPGEAGPQAAWLVSTELPADRLAALGLPFDPGRAADRVRAELLMNPAGEVLAVRVLR